MDPRTNIILESFLIFFDTLCVAFSIVYVVQLRRAPVQSYRGQLDVSWTKAGSGALNLLPPIFTLVLAIADVLLYGLVYMPPAYGFLMSSTMLFGWMAVFVLWTQCHISLFDDVRGFCYQESLQSGRSPSMYEGVDEGIIRAAMVFAVFIILIYFIYVVVALRQWVKAARIWKAQREAGPTPIELRRQLERGRGSNLACLIDKAIPDASPVLIITTMVQVKTYALPPTDLIPNSPHVLIHYPRLLEDLVKSPSFTPSAIYDTFARNGWYSQWIARYGPDQASHYHSAAHECMAVISGEGATIRFGVADASSDADGHENGGVEVQASLGDVFVLPAGVAHKTFRPRPDSIGLDFMAPEDENGKLVASPTEARAYFEQVKMTGAFMMMGAYPKGYEWDFMVGGEHKGRFPEVWNVSVPEADPVLGVDPEGLRGLWSNSAKKE